ncbi:uncharacterized protein LOC132395177 [Hypanus sabinus]|uniref:uncharacterized protein LOC132395177 n=1 Tax=Hypanus sabinus TaxID=79690 RepID=UPI0028C3FB29|nr:uncharacterized protein LOC132395177 [Hypanus sabinus]
MTFRDMIWLNSSSGVLNRQAVAKYRKLTVAPESTKAFTSLQEVSTFSMTPKSMGRNSTTNTIIFANGVYPTPTGREPEPEPEPGPQLPAVTALLRGYPLPRRRFYLLLLVLCGGVATFPLTERTAAAAPGCATCDSLALEIQSSAAELRDAQLCEYFSFCDGDQGSLLTHDFNLPQIRSQDRCTKISFHKVSEARRSSRFLVK